MTEKDAKDTVEDTTELDNDLELEKSDTDGVVGGIMLN